MQTLYNLAAISAGFKVLASDYDYTLFYNIAYFSIFVLLFKKEMSFVPIKRMLIRIAKTRICIFFLIFLFNQNANVLDFINQRVQIVQAVIAIPFFAGLVYNYESGKVPFKELVSISQDIDFDEERIVTPKFRLYLTLFCVICKSSEYLMDWRSEAKFPDLLISGAAIGGGIIFPILFTLESFIRKREQRESNLIQKEKEE